MMKITMFQSNQAVRSIVFNAMRLIFFFCGMIVLPQVLITQEPVDTFQLVYALQSAGKLKAASAVLEHYTADHPSDGNALWLYARNEYWQKRHRHTRHLYASALRQEPENKILRIDFATSLLGMGRFAEAEKSVRKFKPGKETNSDANVMLAKFYYWTGDYKKADKFFQSAREAYPESPELHRLGGEMYRASAPWIQLEGSYYSDSQPLHAFLPTLAAGLYSCRLLQPRLRLQTPVYFLENHTLTPVWIQAGNVSRLVKTGSRLEVNAGAFQQKSGWRRTGSAAINQPFGSRFWVDAEAAHAPYWSTQASLDTTVLVDRLNATLEWRDPQGWQIRAGTQQEYFADDNRVSAWFAWGFAPAIHLGKTALRLGYSFNYSTARESRFFSEKSLAELWINYDSLAPIEGGYVTYFTPKGQKVHAAMINMQLPLTNQLSCSLDGKWGVSAQAQAPYLFLQKNDQTEPVLVREFRQTSYQYREAKASLNWQVSEKLSIAASYAYAQLFFFTNHTAQLGLRMSILK